MSFIYKNNEQTIVEIKKLMLENKVSQRKVAESLNISPQSLNKIFNKKNLSLEDIKKLLDTMGFELLIDFVQSHKD